MGRLTIVRHGQAAFMTDDYDRLSPLGEEQSRALGRYWARHGMQFTHAFTGPRRRHRGTGDHATAAAREAGHALPEMQHAPGLDEFEWEALLQHALSDECAADAALTRLRAEFLAAETYAERRRAIHYLMEAVTERWVLGELNAPGAEPFTAFQARVHADIGRILDAAGKGGHAVVFTSGGPAAVTAGLALELAPRKILDLIWTLRNGGLIEFLYTGGRLSLSAYNAAPHLETPDLWTYR
jgi:broad specificity phosphatase PhoE